MRAEWRWCTERRWWRRWQKAALLKRQGVDQLVDLMVPLFPAQACIRMYFAQFLLRRVR